MSTPTEILYLFGTTTRLGKAVECVCEDFFESAYLLRTYHCLREYCLEGEIARIMYSQPIAVVGALTLVTDIADTTASWWHGSCGRVSKGPSVWWCIRQREASTRDSRNSCSAVSRARSLCSAGRRAAAAGPCWVQRSRSTPTSYRVLKCMLPI